MSSTIGFGFRNSGLMSDRASGGGGGAMKWVVVLVVKGEGTDIGECM